jgi:hypothetical protein
LKGRDLAILAAVLLLGGFALADSLRSRGSEAVRPTIQTEREGPPPEPDVQSDWPVGRLRGTLVFTNAGDCRVRVIDLGEGRERSSGRFQGSCRLWAAPVGQRIAYSIRGGNSQYAERWFGIVDLAQAERELGTFKNVVGDVLWSPDAQRVAWCVFGSAEGRELEIGSLRPRRLSRCPLAYDLDGRLAFARGKRLVAEDGMEILVEDEPIVQADWGEDGSLLVVLADGSVRRHNPNGSFGPIVLVTDRRVVPSPDNCATLVEEFGKFHLVDLGCARIRERSFAGRDAAWSPDGHWVAVADEEQIVFHEVGADADVLVWPARANELYWRGED